METKKKALGRGLEQLFNSENLDLDINNIQKLESRIYESTNKEDVVEINIDELRANPYQPRKVFKDEALQELAASIKEHGVFQPIIVKKSIKGYEIIAGERRVRASKLAGLEKIPAIVRNLSDELMMEIALLENLQRENLSCIEEANAYKSMLTTLGLTQEALAIKVGKSRSHVTNMLGLLRLPQSVQDLVNKGDLSMGHARVLSKIEDNDKIIELANKIINEKLAVRDIEQISDDKEIKKKIKITRHSSNDQENYKYVENLLREKYDSKVKIKDKKIEISFTSTADLNRILEIMDIKG
ncbi:MAG: ParB/RepB/Spo0J family partition protein [Bacilli bacterium]|nr:ParB/RepB/Spo0J family partition protein [Bacilli bacterium]MCI9435406.1 ParB/RepB/Spo0J family partition protein [Bacilli bacterium]